MIERLKTLPDSYMADKQETQALENLTEYLAAHPLMRVVVKMVIQAISRCIVHHLSNKRNYKRSKKDRIKEQPHRLFSLRGSTDQRE